MDKENKPEMTPFEKELVEGFEEHVRKLESGEPLLVKKITDGMDPIHAELVDAVVALHESGYFAAALKATAIKQLDDLVSSESFDKCVRGRKKREKAVMKLLQRLRPPDPQVFAHELLHGVVVNAKRSKQ